jgi:hypothetical protein
MAYTRFVYFNTNEVVFRFLLRHAPGGFTIAKTDFHDDIGRPVKIIVKLQQGFVLFNTIMRPKLIQCVLLNAGLAMALAGVAWPART